MCNVPVFILLFLQIIAKYPAHPHPTREHLKHESMIYLIYGLCVTKRQNETLLQRQATDIRRACFLSPKKFFEFHRLR